MWLFTFVLWFFILHYLISLDCDFIHVGCLNSYFLLLLLLILITHDICNLLLRNLQELFSLQSCLELNVCLLHWSCRLRLILVLSVSLCSVQEHSNCSQTHQDVLNVMIILMLIKNLLSQRNLLLNEIFFILPIRIVIIPVYRCASHWNILSLSIGRSDLKTCINHLKTLFSAFLLFLDSSFFPSDHPLLVFFGHVFLICNALVELIPNIIFCTI